MQIKGNKTQKVKIEEMLQTERANLAHFGSHASSFRSIGWIT
jgi:hypothetical protein